MKTRVLRTIQDVRSAVADAREKGKSIALVPTMGGLHAGHMSLVDRAKEIADLVIVSIFVNPTQFNKPEDFENYPGDEATDLAELEKSGTDIAFIPSTEEMYPPGFGTRVDISAAQNVLCDAHRPGHFDGVATIVTKLLLQTMPDYACFGEKDFQQLFIIRQLVRDLDIPTNIVPVPTVREKDGLALSSRNKRLTAEERKIAPRLNRAMRQVAEDIKNGVNATEACARASEGLEETGHFRVEYLEMRSAKTLELLEEYETSARLFAGAWLGPDVRLIDNIEI